MFNVGVSSIALAHGFPNTRIEGIDPDAASIGEAHREAAEAGVTDRVTFHQTTIENSMFRLYRLTP